MSKTIDKILEVLDQPLQHADDAWYPTGSVREDSCWRCGVVLTEVTPLGACARCVEDLRNPAASSPPAREAINRWGAVVHDEAHNFFDMAFELTLTVPRDGFDMRGIFEAAPEPNCFFYDGEGNESARPAYHSNPRQDYYMPIAFQNDVVTSETFDRESLLPRLQVDVYRLAEAIGAVGRPTRYKYVRVGQGWT